MLIQFLDVYNRSQIFFKHLSCKIFSDIWNYDASSFDKTSHIPQGKGSNFRKLPSNKVLGPYGKIGSITFGGGSLDCKLKVLVLF